ncbi:short chain dehydrogenase [filamentous cyanobacterium CCT1]|nr:short chain dehydrogenase [filamentous cyanobacterium CCT1]PSN81436.1 short chain dehydrogenase [filamentous cyanobacterium CCP4]
MILQDKVALVTGGTSGIGRATAIAFGAAGAKVVFSGRRDAEGEKTAKLIRETGSECLYFHSDASNEEDIKALVQKTVETYGRLDYAFNNAGSEGSFKPLHEQVIEDFDNLMAINVRGLFLCMKYEIQQMLSQGSGVIVNNSSASGLVAFPETSPYVASKHAVMGLTRTAALDYAKQGIRINAVNPGPIATDIMARAADRWGIPSDELGSMVPMGRIGQAAEIAQAVVFLCSDAASYITGQPLVIDGGYTAR